MKPLDRAFLKAYRSDALTLQSGRCAYCCAPLRQRTATADHVKAVIWGGEAHRDNIKAACEPCNKLKGSMGPQAFLRMIKNPTAGAGLHVWDAWSRRRIWTKTWRTCERITRSAA